MRHLSKVALIIIKVLLFAALLMNVVAIIVLIRNRAAGIDFPLSESNAYLMAEPLLRIIVSTWLFLVLIAVSILCRLGKKWAVFSGSILSLIASGIAGLVALAGAKVSAVTTEAYYMAVVYAALSVGAALFTYTSIRLLASSNLLRNDDTNRARTKLFWLPLVVVLILTGVWSQDETLDQEFNRFYADNHKEVLDKDNVAVGLAGLDAPVGSNFMDVGRAEFQAVLQNTNPNGSEAPALPKPKTKIAFVGSAKELDCWTGMTYPDKGTPSCASEERLSEILSANAELLTRYWQVSRMQHFQGLKLHAKLFLNLNSLIAADVELKLRRGHYEEAYQEWQANYRFLARMIGEDMNWAGKMMLIAAATQSLTSAASLFHAYKEIAAVHGDELIDMLKLSGLARWNLPGAMRTEYIKFIPLLSSTGPGFWFHQNFIRNRFLHSAQAFLEAMDAPPGLVEENTRAAWREFGSVKAWTNDYLRDPMNTALSRTIFRDSLNERVGGLVARMHILDGKQRTLILALLIKRRALKDDEIAPFLASVGHELRNPFTGAPMGWDSTKRTIRFDIPKGGYRSFEVRL